MEYRDGFIGRQVDQSFRCEEAVHFAFGAELGAERSRVYGSILGAILDKRADVLVFHRPI